jgi:hypothetical protein
MKKKILYIDMDMVLCNFDKHILKLDPSIETMDTNTIFKTKK